MIKLIKETNIFEIQPGHDNLNNSEFVYLFANNFIILNIKILPNNYKK